jgi:hypothetical protein
VTTMRSTEPLTGIDAAVAHLLPFLNGTEPTPGEHGVDRHGRIHVWTGQGWAPDLPWWGGLPGMHHRAELAWAAGAEAEAG